MSVDGWQKLKNQIIWYISNIFTIYIQHIKEQKYTHSFCFSFLILYSSAGWRSGTLLDLWSLLGPVPREYRRLFLPISPSALILGVLLKPKT